MATSLLTCVLFVCLWCVPQGSKAQGEQRGRSFLKEGSFNLYHPGRGKCDSSLLDGNYLQNYFRRNSSLLLHIGFGENATEIEIYPSVELEETRTDSRIQKQEKADLNHEEGSELCEFQGRIRGDPSSSVALSLCKGISGVIKSDGDLFEIYEEGYATGSWNGEVRLKQILQDKTLKCGVKEIPAKHSKAGNSSGLAMLVQPKKRSKRNSERKIAYPALLNSWVRYVEVCFVVDKSLYTQLDSDENKVRRRCLSIVNAANTLLESMQLKLVLSNLEIWKTRNNITVVSDPNKLIENFCSEKKRILESGNHHDFTILLSGINFDGNTVGYAYVGLMCKVSSIAVIQHSPTLATVAGTVVHELGHSLGANHDNHDCQSVDRRKVHIMEAEGVHGQTWSNCSKIYFAKNIDKFKCLKNKPKIKPGFQFCGNGFLEHGEQCDCGRDGPCKDCCHTSNCTLKPHALCGTGGCCDFKTCKPYPAATKCRGSATECDLPEYCTGSEICPQNYFKYDGTPCQDGQGRCYQGECRSKDSLCKFLVNPSSKVVENEIIYKRLKKNNPCTEIDCKVLFNYEGSTSLYTEEAYIIYKPFSFLRFVSNSPYDIFTTFDGIPCGDNKTCQNNQCLPSPTSGNSHCKEGCGGHGVCNTGDHCHCDMGFAPPDCKGRGLGGSLIGGYAYVPKVWNHFENTMLAIFIFLPIIFMVCCCWTEINREWYERKLDQKLRSKSTKAGRCVENCCCPCMGVTTQWTDLLWRRLKKDIEPAKTEIITDPPNLRKTICEVEVDINPPEDEVKSWGVASETLVTDIISVTPQSTPDLKRKIMLPSKSRFDEKMNRPDYMQSLSKDSGCHSDTEEDGHGQGHHSYKGSMSSLICRFKNFGKEKTVSDDIENASQDLMTATTSTNTKELDLRRMVVTKRQLSRQDSNISVKSEQNVPGPLTRSHGGTFSHLQNIAKPITLSERNLNRMPSRDEKNNKNLEFSRPLLPPKIPNSNAISSTCKIERGPTEKRKQADGPTKVSFPSRGPILPPQHRRGNQQTTPNNQKTPIRNYERSKGGVADIAKKFEA